MDKQLILFYICQTNLNDRSLSASLFIKMLKENHDWNHSLSYRYPYRMKCPGFADGLQCMFSYLCISFLGSAGGCSAPHVMIGHQPSAPSTYHPPTPRLGAWPLFVQCLLPLAILPPSALAHQLKEETMHRINSYSTFRASGRCWFMNRIFHITNRKTGFRYTNFSTPPTLTHTHTHFTDVPVAWKWLLIISIWQHRTQGPKRKISNCFNPHSLSFLFPIRLTHRLIRIISSHPHYKLTFLARVPYSIRPLLFLWEM